MSLSKNKIIFISLGAFVFCSLGYFCFNHSSPPVVKDEKPLQNELIPLDPASAPQDKSLKIAASQMSAIKIDTHEKYELKDIHYDPDSDSLSPDSHYQIRKLASHLLQNYPHLYFVIETHLFESEDPKENEHSALRMAHALKSAFIKAGINPVQVDVKAFGGQDLSTDEGTQNLPQKQKIELLFYALHEE